MRIAQKIRAGLACNHSVTEAIYDAGFNSNSRFYEASGKMLGMTPSDYRAGDPQIEIRFAIVACSLGAILVAQSARCVCAILMGDDPNKLAQNLQDKFPHANLSRGDRQMVAQVVSFIEAPALGLTLPLDVRGTAFQQRLWQALREIPVGSTASYANIASRNGAPKVVRAVVQACAANFLAVAIPCHRVVCSDGALSGYRRGEWNARARCWNVKVRMCRKTANCNLCQISVTGSEIM